MQRHKCMRNPGPASSGCPWSQVWKSPKAFSVNRRSEGAVKAWSSLSVPCTSESAGQSLCSGRRKSPCWEASVCTGARRPRRGGGEGKHWGPLQKPSAPCFFASCYSVQATSLLAAVSHPRKGLLPQWVPSATPRTMLAQVNQFLLQLTIKVDIIHPWHLDSQTHFLKP